MLGGNRLHTRNARAQRSTGRISRGNKPPQRKKEKKRKPPRGRAENHV